MKPQTRLTVMSLLSIGLMTLHLAGDVVHGMDAGGRTLLVGVVILAVWLYGTVALSGRRAGHVIMLLGSLFGCAMPVIHTAGSGLGGDFAKSEGALLYIFTILALGASAAVAFVLCLQALRSGRSPGAVRPAEP